MCGKVIHFSSHYSQKQKEGTKFCSRNCVGKYKSLIGRKNINCVVCGKPISATLTEITHGASTCSMRCKYLKLKQLFVGKKNPFYGKKHTKETRELIREKQFLVPKPKLRGANNHFWRGGVSQINHIVRNNIMKTPEYRMFRLKVIDRDKVCQQCGATTNLEVHHIKEFALYPRLRLDEQNALTLCKSCHTKTDSFGRKTYNIEFIIINYLLNYDRKISCSRERVNYSRL